MQERPPAVEELRQVEAEGLCDGEQNEEVENNLKEAAGSHAGRLKTFRDAAKRKSNRQTAAGRLLRRSCNPSVSHSLSQALVKAQAATKNNAPMARKKKSCILLQD